MDGLSCIFGIKNFTCIYSDTNLIINSGTCFVCVEIETLFTRNSTKHIMSASSRHAKHAVQIVKKGLKSTTYGTTCTCMCTC